MLILILRNVRHRLQPVMLEQRLFIALIWINAVLLIADSLMWLLDGKTGFGVRESYYVVTTVYYFLNPLICLIWYCYVDYLIFRNRPRLKLAFPLLLLPQVISMVLTLLSPVYHIYFYIDEQNVYHRGVFFLIMAACSYIYLFAATGLILFHRKAIRDRVCLPLLFFALLPAVGAIFQILFYGLSVTWICSTISILIIFISLQNDQLYTDYLTGLFNRRQLDSYLQQQVSNNPERLGGIMMDINSFKEINDRYGHMIGDHALRALSGILRKTFDKGEFIARYGGDEFVIILSDGDISTLRGAIDRLCVSLGAFNATSELPFPLCVSVGYDTFAASGAENAEQFLRRIDFLMYEDKKRQSVLK